MSSAELPHEPTAALKVQRWQPWFAWRPVRLYMTGRFIWLKRVYRRCVIKPVGAIREYTDNPAEFPDLAEVKAVTDSGPKPAPRLEPEGLTSPARTL